jgi:hypothetical protein
MLRPVALDEIENVELIPQVVIRKPVSFFEQHLGVRFVEGRDDLDVYRGVAMSLNAALPFVLKHYKGHPPETTTIYLPIHIHDVEKISGIIRTILDELKVPLDCIEWQRSDDPTL